MKINRDRQSRGYGRLATVFLGSVLVATSQAFAAVYHVSPAGADTNPGTESQPFRTIQKAANIVVAGDKVIVEDGTYTGTGTGTPCASNSRPIVCLSRGGASGSPVTFQARNVGGAKLDGQGNTSTDGFRFLSGANFVVIDGFEIFGMGNSSGSSSGLELYSGGHDVVITRNRIHDIGRLCTDTTNGQVGIFLEQPRVTISRNVIHDIGRFAPSENGCSPATGYYKNHDHGIYVDGDSVGSSIPGAADTVIVNNIFYNHGRGWAIQAYPGSLPRLKILNNTFAFPNPYSDGHILLGAATTDARIANNVFYKPKTAAINYYTGAQTNLQLTRNVAYGATLMTSTPSGASVSGTKTSDPAFVNATLAPFDFHLTATSPAIDAGTAFTEASVDYDGATRDAAYDAGAFEFGGASAQPNTAPWVAIDSPSNGASFVSTTAVTFTARADDAEDGVLSGAVSWKSSVSGPLGTGATLTKTLSAGTHVVTATVVDSAGASASVSVTVTVTTSTPPAGSGITLAANGYVLNGSEKVDLAWTGISTQKVDIYRNGKRLVTIKNDGKDVDTIGTAKGTYTYKVCARASSTVCSPDVKVVF